MEEIVIGQSQIDLATWNDTRTTISITASAENASAITINAGYLPGGSDILGLTNPGTSSTLELSDLNHGSNQMLYISVIPIDAENNEHPELATYAVYPIPNPIIGVIKTCDETKYIVDIVEKKRGATNCSERWKNGQRVVVTPPCEDMPGKAIPTSVIRDVLSTTDNIMSGKISVNTNGSCHYVFNTQDSNQLSGPTWSDYIILSDGVNYSPTNLREIYYDFTSLKEVGTTYNIWLNTLSGSWGEPNNYTAVQLLINYKDGTDIRVPLSVDGTKFPITIQDEVDSIQLEWVWTQSQGRPAIIMPTKSGDAVDFTIEWQKTIPSLIRGDQLIDNVRVISHTKPTSANLQTPWEIEYDIQSYLKGENFVKATGTVTKASCAGSGTFATGNITWNTVDETATIGSYVTGLGIISTYSNLTVSPFSTPLLTPICRITTKGGYGENQAKLWVEYYDVRLNKYVNCEEIIWPFT